ncbi:hypothetical protein BH10ACT9_BH10ACT9_43130 [soil metagenome]
MNTDEYLYFLDRALQGILTTVDDLGDDLANRTPPVDGANSPWAIGFHCTEVAEYWIGHLIAGRASTRNRAAEFSASGSVADLALTINRLSGQLRRDLEDFDPGAPLRNTPPQAYEGPSRALTATGVLLHVLEELAQHHGQVQVSRDILLLSAKVAP